MWEYYTVKLELLISSRSVDGHCLNRDLAFFSTLSQSGASMVFSRSLFISFVDCSVLFSGELHSTFLSEIFGCMLARGFGTCRVKLCS